jgi:hypothetical protein
LSSLKRLAGELLIDHSNSPGISAELAAKWERMGVTTAGAGEKLEAATYTCRHCQLIVIMNPNRQRERNVCRKCMAIVCDRPSCVLECRPFAAVIERAMSGRAVQVDPTTNLLLPS